jgi:hypothetical protein
MHDYASALEHAIDLSKLAHVIMYARRPLNLTHWSQALLALPVPSHLLTHCICRLDQNLCRTKYKVHVGRHIKRGGRERGRRGGEGEHGQRIDWSEKRTRRREECFRDKRRTLQNTHQSETAGDFEYYFCEKTTFVFAYFNWSRSQACALCGEPTNTFSLSKLAEQSNDFTSCRAWET